MAGRGISFDSFTPGALRASRRAEARARSRDGAEVGAADLAAALADEGEGRAVALLIEFGLSPARVAEALGLRAADAPSPGEDGPDFEDDAPALPWSSDCRAAIGEATARARALTRGQSIGTEHLLVGLLAMDGSVSAALDAAGLRVADLLARQEEIEADQGAPIPVGPEVAPLELVEPGQEIDLARILDASANRAREGLRVIEDFARFALDDPMLTRRLKEVRHRFATAMDGLDPALLLASRDTRGDVGTHIMTASEQARESPRAVLIANFKRTAEALRSLEEYSKLVDVWVSGRFEVLRYDVYTLEKLVLNAAASRRGIGDARLMVLVGGLPTLGDLTWIVGEALAGGADVIQLREKGLPDRELLSRAREVRILTAQARARFILNDRPDLARLAGADGVHLGQEDVTVRDARRIVGPGSLIGVSTHEPAQVEAAVLDTAGYLGVGPVFASTTKGFDDLAGLGFVARAAEITSLPWFAIGGITEENLDEVLEAGARRIAVSAAVVRAEFPRRAAAALKARLDAAS
ncbi:thiamine phosphate synthase [Tundrisphaera sp. TA3]|uniref:thiamine phosphate synthase n=1 Tax=Tundrisphaera sp. TA3 TaxID=3435775 RepID=UPI003EBD9887